MSKNTLLQSGSDRTHFVKMKFLKQCATCYHRILSFNGVEVRKLPGYIDPDKITLENERFIKYDKSKTIYFHYTKHCCPIYDEIEAWERRKK